MLLKQLFTLYLLPEFWLGKILLEPESGNIYFDVSTFFSGLFNKICIKAAGVIVLYYETLTFNGRKYKIEIKSK